MSNILEGKNKKWLLNGLRNRYKLFRAKTIEYI